MEKCCLIKFVEFLNLLNQIVKLFTNAAIIKCQPSTNTNSIILNGKATITGDIIIIPIDINKLATTISIIKNGKYTIEITNDGEKPKGEIIEGGGLSGLRLLVERENGTMIIHSAPQFELIIELPQGETL